MRSAHLKHLNEEKVKQRWWGNSTYRLRYWNVEYSTPSIVYVCIGCNSTYHLRYALKGARQQRSKVTMGSTHRKYLNEEKVKRRWWSNSTYRLRYWNNGQYRSNPAASSLRCNNTYRLRYWNPLSTPRITSLNTFSLQQYLPFTVCAAKCEVVEEQSDDEAHTSQVPEQSEGKTKVIR